MLIHCKQWLPLQRETCMGLKRERQTYILLHILLYHVNVLAYSKINFLRILILPTKVLISKKKRDKIVLREKV